MEAPDILDMLSCLKELAMVFAVPAHDVVRVSEWRDWNAGMGDLVERWTLAQHFKLFDLSLLCSLFLF